MTVEHGTSVRAGMPKPGEATEQPPEGPSAWKSNQRSSPPTPTPQTDSTLESWVNPTPINAKVPEGANQLLQHFMEMFLEDADTLTIDQALPPAGAASPLEPDRFEHFHIVAKIGQGGMGTVYLAEDTRLGRQVAIKTLHPRYREQETAKTRFVAEARMAAQLQHDHIIPIYHVGEVDGLPYLAMPLLSGDSLESVMTEGDHLLPLTETLRIGREIALGLQHAHTQGLIHRDIKPANIWLESPDRRVKILDFGLAKSNRGQPKMSSTGLIVGTPAYMSPEQARGLSADGRSDLFSLGVILYELTTGRKPFTGADTLAVLSSLAIDEPPPPAMVNQQISEQLSTLISTLLQKEPERRPASAQEVANQLAAMSNSLETTTPALPMRRPQDAVVPSQSTAKIRQQHKTPENRRRWGRYHIMIAAISAMMIITAVVVIIKDKNGKEIARVEVPNDGRVEIVPSVKEAEAKPPEPKKDAERLAAEYVLSIGGSVYVVGSEDEIRVVDDLPEKPFQLSSIFLIENQKLANSKLSLFNQCQSLEYLNLYKTVTSNAGLANFKQCKKLQTLLLTLTQVTDAGLEPFKDCRDLEEIHLSSTLITDRALTYFKNCPKLTGLHVANTDITDVGIKVYQDHLKFTRIDVSYTSVSDQSIKILSRWKNLEHLDITCCNITEPGYRQLLKALPKCKIRWALKKD